MRDFRLALLVASIFVLLGFWADCAVGFKLPRCPTDVAGLNEANTEACTKEVQLSLGYQNCNEQSARRCCPRVDRIAKHRCHCSSTLTAAQKLHIENLATQCTRQVRRGRSGRDRAPRLFVGVLTAGQNVLARQAIRDTWGGDSRLHRVVFFTAKPRDPLVFNALRKEAAAKRDIVVLPTIWESYYNITHQTLEVLRASALDLRVTHTLKADDDSYVRVDEVLNRIQNAPPQKMFMGFIENPGGGPHRNPSSQWHVTEAEWPSERYPPWAHGAGYILSQDLVQEIAAGAALQAQDHQIFKLEDIAVGSWVEWVGKDKKWDINYVVDQAFNYNGCNSQDAVSHYIKPPAMRCMFKNEGACCAASSLFQPHIRGGGT